MSIASKIQTLTSIRADIRNALVQKGISAASSHNFSNFATDISAIKEGIPFSSAKIKIIVPAGLTALPVYNNSIGFVTTKVSHGNYDIFYSEVESSYFSSEKRWKIRVYSGSSYRYSDAFSINTNKTYTAGMDLDGYYLYVDGCDCDVFSGGWGATVSGGIDSSTVPSYPTGVQLIDNGEYLQATTSDSNLVIAINANKPIEKSYGTTSPTVQCTFSATNSSIYAVAIGVTNYNNNLNYNGGRANLVSMTQFNTPITSSCQCANNQYTQYVTLRAYKLDGDGALNLHALKVIP